MDVDLLKHFSEDHDEEALGIVARLATQEGNSELRAVTRILLETTSRYYESRSQVSDLQQKLKKQQAEIQRLQKEVEKAARFG